MISREETNILKGYAILAVILEHATGLGLISFVSLETAGILCEIGMGLFLFLSGYGLYQSYLKNGMAGFWEKKILKVFFPYSIIQILLLIYSFLNREVVLNAKEIIGHLLGLAPNNKLDSTMWYISFLLFLYFVFFVVFSFFPLKQLIFIWIAIAAGLFIVCPFVWEYSFYCTMSFPLGVLYSCYEEKVHNIIKGKTVFAIDIVSLLLLFVWYQKFRQNNFWENIFVLYFGLIFIFSIKYINQEKYLKWLKKIGKNSFFLYLMEYKFFLLSIYGFFQNYQIGKTIQILLFIFMFLIMLFLADFLSKMQNFIIRKMQFN